MFEDMYDSRSWLPFYVTLGNHDYEQNSQIGANIPRNILIPAGNIPPNGIASISAKPAKLLATILMLDSNKPKLTKEEWAGDPLDGCRALQI
jgi:hypothetical protein